MLRGTSTLSVCYTANCKQTRTYRAYTHTARCLSELDFGWLSRRVVHSKRIEVIPEEGMPEEDVPEEGVPQGVIPREVIPQRLPHRRLAHGGLSHRKLSQSQGRQSRLAGPQVGEVGILPRGSGCSACRKSWAGYPRNSECSTLVSTRRPWKRIGPRSRSMTCWPGYHR